MFIKNEVDKIQSLRNPKKFWILWEVRHGDSTSVEDAMWLAKEDCPSVVHGTYDRALKEADRLSQKTGKVFAVMETVALVHYKTPIPVEIKSDVKLLTAH